MLKSFIQALVIVAGLVWAGTACAVGFGTATVGSALGQPLKVEISLTDVSDADRSSLVATLASPDTFKTAGLDYPYHLSKLKFTVLDRGGQTYIEVTSKEPVNDSFINLLVELNWNAGRLLREYTFLLDPPEYKAEQPKAEEVTPIEPAVSAAPVPEVPQVQPLPGAAPASGPAATEALVPAVPQAESAPAAAPAPEALVAASAPEAAPAPGAEQLQPVPAAPAEVAPPPTAAAAAVRPAVKETITVRRGDTLSKIAAQLKEPDVTLEQMIVALYRANVNKFDGKNMNRLRAGKILTVPDPDSYQHLSSAEAAKVIRAQTASWHAYRQRLAAAVAAPAVQAPKQEAGGKVTTAVTEKAPQPKEAPGGKLVLSQGQAPGGKPAAGGKAPAPQATAQQAKEEAIAKEKAAQEAEKRAAALEKNVQDMKKLVELKGSAPAAASAVAPASGVRPAKPKLPQAAPAPEPSLLDDILSNPVFDYLQDPVYLGAGAGVLVVLGGAGYFLARRRREGGGGRKKKK